MESNKEELINSDVPIYIHPPINIYEDNLNYYYEVITPGFEKDELSIILTNEKYITISGNYRLHVDNVKFPESDKEIHVKDVIETEYSLCSFSRKIEIFDDMDLDKISSKYKNGILEIKIGRKVEISTQIKIDIE